MSAVAALLVLGGCSGPASVKSAREKVDAFHKQFNAGEYGAIWDGAGAEIQNSVKREDFVKGLDGVHTFWGDELATSQISWGYKDNSDGSYSSVVMKTDFRNGRAYEEFAFRNIGDKQILAQYNITKNPPPTDGASSAPSDSASAAPSKAP